MNNPYMWVAASSFYPAYGGVYDNRSEGNMDEEMLAIVIRESVSLFVLLLVLVGGYKMLTRLITIFDVHLNKIEDLVSSGIELLEDYTGKTSH